jgi:hypothetical protein
MTGIWHRLGVVAGGLLILIGIPLFLTPLPGGLACTAAGTALVVALSPRAQRFVRRQRNNHPKLDRGLNRVEERIPERARGPLRKLGRTPIARRPEQR